MVFLDDDVVEELVLDHVVAGGVARGERGGEEGSRGEGRGGLFVLVDDDDLEVAGARFSG